MYFGVLLMFVLYPSSHGISLSWISTGVESSVHRTPRSVGTWYDMRKPRAAAPASSSSSSSSANTFLSRFRRQSNDVQKPIISYLHIESTVVDRFSETVVTSVVTNPDIKNREAAFNLEIPDTAFISNFTMLIDNKLLLTEVKSKKEAEEMFRKAQEENKTAGIVSSEEERFHFDKPQRNMERFTVTIGIKANSSIEFTLTYLQRLERVLGFYEQTISMRPNQIVDNFLVDVFIYEKQGVKDVSMFKPSSSANSVHNEIADVSSISESLVHATFYPTVEQQRKMDPVKGVNVDLTVIYDVNHNNDAGLLKVENNEYFIHYFSPSEQTYQALSKNIVFVIDISGSMSGTKMEQTRKAMYTILGQLRNSDNFMMLLFDDATKFWPSRSKMSEVNERTISDARSYANDELRPDGGTNINDALVEACYTLRSMETPAGSNLIVFLTDGEPTAGETQPNAIVINVQKACSGLTTIFSLAFGDYTDYSLLEKLSLSTGGKVKKIYDESDASQQLNNFYQTISNPLLYDIRMNYPDNIVNIDTVTQSIFRQYFGGSELAVAGKLLESIAPGQSTGWLVEVTGYSSEEKQIKLTSSAELAPTDDVLPENAPNDLSLPDGFVEKLYIYMKIKFLIEQMKITDDLDKKKAIEEEALALALEYKFVTPLTSMIIVQQDNNGDEGMESDVATGKSLSSASATCSMTSLVCPMAIMILGTLIIR